MTRSMHTLLSSIIDRYMEASNSREKLYVSRIAGRFRRAKGRGAAAGKRFHSKIWSLDPYDILNYEEMCTPFPLAWRFRFGWLLGVPDQLCFRHGVPFAVVEYKSYNKTGEAELVQAGLYGILAELNFAQRIEVYLEKPGGLFPLPEWEIHALKGLKAASRAHRQNTRE